MKLPPKVDDTAVRKQVEAVLPDAQVMDFQEGNPALSQGLDNATAILSLICLVAMVLGAIGVAMAMHAHLEQRMDMLAILKAVGAGSADLLRIFLLQTLGLGLAGGLLGVAAGVAVMAALPAVFGKLLPVHAVLHFPWRSAAAGLGTGLLDDAAVLSAAAAGCARGEAGAGAAQAGRAGAGRGGRMASRVGGRGVCNWESRVVGIGAGRNCLGACLTRRRWADGLRCCSRLRWWFCWCWRRWRYGRCVFCSIACGCGCRRSCAMGWRIFIGRGTSRRRCWRRWARA